ncbi:alpha/beta fold hydrolase [Nostoc sp. JL33]|uniref:alpha/beta fold hydrolase n=1 Tax=Nostoc sp. JL33 TaxID=2815396 RepID=UPI0025E3E0DB|nr:alpha/beta hydrolase [Nostoc sp. JL33]MBN3869024.1 hypothetical protein [Nostoc sp. JL33]
MTNGEHVSPDATKVGTRTVTPTCVETIHRGISGSEWVLFENSLHMPHLEETERFLQILGEFLNRVETARYR